MTLPQRLAVVVYSSGELAFLVLVWVAFVSLALESRVGAYVVLAGVAVHFGAKQLAIPVFAHAEGDLDDLTRAECVYLLVATCGHLAIAAGIAGGFAGWRDGAYVAVAGLTAACAGHLSVGVSAYRRVMAREWPDVPTLLDDD